jgi:hypothetical protein
MIIASQAKAATPAQVRRIDSGVFTGDADETVIDHAAMAAQVGRGVIDYASVSPAC